MLLFKNMQVNAFVHDGVRYEFQPPIEVGDRQVDSLPKLAAIALMGADMPDSVLSMGARQAEAALFKSRGYELTSLNSMLEGKHSVVVG